MPTQTTTDSGAENGDSQPDTESSNGSTGKGQDSTQPSPDTARVNDGVPITDLLERETTIPFAGLTPDDDHVYPEEISLDGRGFGPAPTSLKEAIEVLPQATDGELWTTNEFVGTDGDIDIDAIRRVHGLDVDAIESATDRSLEDLAGGPDRDPIVRVDDHKDIVDERRKALNALGFDVKFRWQIATDAYTIINPQEAYLPIISALQRRGENDVFGWVSYRDWGGLLKMFIVCPGLRQAFNGDPDDETASGAEQEGVMRAAAGDRSHDDRKLVVYGGFETGYDFRGSQALWAKPILFFPDSGTVLPDTGERYTRRHYGRAMDTAHERANDRVPITEWWRSIYDDVDVRMITVDEAIRQTRAIAYDFEELPFGAEDCYEYWGVARTYATAAAERATALAKPTTRPTVFNLQLSLLITLRESYEGSMASDTFQEYLEVAGELLRKPSMMIQLALKEHDRQTVDQSDRILPNDQQTLSDTLEDLAAIPGIDVDTEIDLSDQQAQRLQNRVQRTFEDL